tara:strand:- start:1402 stop:1851 length:450 start_codon:yes stop_codon:yes gene_type:complete
MKKAITIFFISILVISCAEEKKEIFPKSLINKTLYLSPYFVCRNNLIVDENYNFILTTYSIGTLSSADKYIIKGKFIKGNKVVFNGSNVAGGFTYTENVDIFKSEFGSHDMQYPIVRFKANYWNVTKGENDVGIMDYAVPKNGKCEPGY